MRNDERNIMPGDRVLVFDSSLFENDVKTPLSYTMRPATVVCRYGKVAQHFPISDMTLGPYPDLVDVIFDHKPKLVSHGHFTSGVDVIRKEEQRRPIIRKHKQLGLGA